MLEYIHSAAAVSSSMVTMSHSPQSAAYDLRKTPTEDLTETYSRDTWIASLDNLSLFASRLEAVACAYHACIENVEATAVRAGRWKLQVEI